jgi:hypothetical protein
MLQTIYKRLIRLHPRFFRDRFGEEMMAIFDEARTPFAKIRLIGDLTISLMRQWILRPQFWHEPVIGNPIPVGGAPEFLVFENFRPRAGALIDGALLSAIVFTLVCFTMGYAWNHPVLIRIVQPYWRISRGPVASRTAPTRLTPVAPLAAESSTYVEEGRVVLVFPSARVNGSPDAAVLPRMTSVPAPMLASYVGTYRTDAGQNVIVKLRATELTIQESGSAPVALTPISATQFVSRSRHDYLVSFRTNQSGAFDSLEIVRNGARIIAQRR